MDCIVLNREHREECHCLTIPALKSESKSCSERNILMLNLNVISSSRSGGFRWCLKSHVNCKEACDGSVTGGILLVSSSPGSCNAIPAFILTGAPCCQFAAKCHGKLDPVLSHLPQLAGQIWHLRTWTLSFILQVTGESHPKSYRSGMEFKTTHNVFLLTFICNRISVVHAINENHAFLKCSHGNPWIALTITTWDVVSMQT